ncbi:hypothetical protein D3C81_1377670 [compost metagenome]
MTGQKAAIWVERTNNSAVGISPWNPPKSQPQKGIPDIPLVNPATIEERKASYVERSSPAQCIGNF